MRGRFVVAAIGLMGLAGAADAKPAAPVPSQRFSMRDFRDWRAPNDKTIYIRVRMHDFYRLDLAGACPDLISPRAFLITKTRGARLGLLGNRLDSLGRAARAGRVRHALSGPVHDAAVPRLKRSAAGQAL